MLLLNHAGKKPGTPRRRSAMAFASLPATVCCHHWPALPAKYGSDGAFDATAWRCSRVFNPTQATSGRAARRAATRAACSVVSGRAKRNTCALAPTGSRRGMAWPQAGNSRNTPSSRLTSASMRFQRSDSAPTAELSRACARSRATAKWLGASCSWTIKP